MFFVYLDGLLKISQKEGVGALWNGVEASFILSGNPAIHFMVYEGLKRMFVRSKRANGLKLVSINTYFILIGMIKRQNNRKLIICSLVFNII